MKKMFVAVALCALSTGCASIVTGSNQSLSVATRENMKPVIGANCKLTNDKGQWYVTTPGSVVVHRAYGDLIVQCQKDGMQPGIATFKSSTKGMMAGNILFGGFIGAGVDASTGAAYDYPNLLTIEMGKTMNQIGQEVVKANASAPSSPPSVK